MYLRPAYGIRTGAIILFWEGLRGGVCGELRSSCCGSLVLPYSLKSTKQRLQRIAKMEPHKTPEVNQASGNSIFWALVALALNAVTEPSRIGSLLIRPRSGSGTATDSNPVFDPLRSSPVICAAETVLDIIFFIFEPKPQRTLSSTDAAPSTPNTTEHRPVGGGRNPEVLSDPALETIHHPEPNTEDTISSRPTLKTLAFFLGVLPQAIKLFSMRGIVGTQICAAMLLAASVARAISCKSPSHFAVSIDILAEKDAYTVPRFLLFLITPIAHYIVYIWLYANIAPGILHNAAAAAASNRSLEILFDLAIYLKILYMLFGVLTMYFNIAWRRSLPYSKSFPFLLACLIPHLDASTRHAGSRSRTPLWMKNSNQAHSLIAVSFIGCLQVSALCIATGRVLSRLAAKRATRFGGHSDGSLPTTSTNAHDPGLMSRSPVTDNSVQRMISLKSGFLGLCKAVDNHGEWLGTWHKGLLTSTEHFALACGIFNLLTALLYYLVVFDSTGTWSPSWTSVLG